MRRSLVRGLRILSAVVLFVPMAALAESYVVVPDLIFTEIKVRNDTLGLDEFIEIYNPGTEALNLNNYLIGYINTPTPMVGEQYEEAVIGDGLIEPGKSLVLAKEETHPSLSLSKKSPFSSLSDSGGTLRITDSAGNNVDQFSWVSTLGVAFAPIQYLCTSSTNICNINRAQSFTREKDENSNYVLDSPTWSLVSPTPESAVLVPAPEPEPGEEPEPEPVDEPVDDQALAPTEQPAAEESETPDQPANAPLLPPAITELLPNPTPPFTDSLDEFVEIYNPNDVSLDITGYKIQTGNTYSYSYELTNITIPGRGYITVTSGNTNLSLANTGGKARLLDTQGVVVSEAVSYAEAPDGQSWANISGTWQWTATPTPGAENVLTAILAASKTSAKKATTTKTKKATTKAKAKTASAKTASAKKPASTKANTGAGEQDEEPEIVPVHTGVLAIIGGLTLVYAGYEYRHDVLNRIYQFRRHREARRASRG